MATVVFGHDQATWEEHDFTTTSSDRRTLAAMSQRYDSRAAMDAHNSLSWMSGCDGNTDQTYNSVSAMFPTGPFELSDLDEMEPEALSTSQSTSRSQSYSIPALGHQGQSDLSSLTEKVCPLLAGQSSECTPQLCGPDAACLDFSHYNEIEDCTSAPCITQKLSTSPDPTKTSPPPSVSIADTVSHHSSRSQAKRQTRNSQQRLQHMDQDDASSKTHSKKAHSLVERRYRENLNGNIAQLHSALLKTKRVGRCTPQDQEEEPEDRRQAFSKVRKSDVMLEAVDYVHQTEVELRHMANEIQLLNSRVRELEKLVKCEDCALMKQIVNFSL